jgi:hypothetical protein
VNERNTGRRGVEPLAGCSVVFQPIRSRLLELRVGGRGFYVCPSRLQRLYLLWTFRNFLALRRETLNRHQQRLLRKLSGSAKAISDTIIDRTTLIGTVENAVLPGRETRGVRQRSEANAKETLTEIERRFVAACNPGRVDGIAARPLANPNEPPGKSQERKVEWTTLSELIGLCIAAIIVSLILHGFLITTAEEPMMAMAKRRKLPTIAAETRVRPGAIGMRLQAAPIEHAKGDSASHLVEAIKRDLTMNPSLGISSSPIKQVQLRAGPLQPSSVLFALDPHLIGKREARTILGIRKDNLAGQGRNFLGPLANSKSTRGLRYSPMCCKGQTQSWLSHLVGPFNASATRGSLSMKYCLLCANISNDSPSSPHK